jgi:hypothetical protein
MPSVPVSCCGRRYGDTRSANAKVSPVVEDVF